ncbi:MAG: hypothetical protein ACLS3M_01630 [Collinsella sp.]
MFRRQERKVGSSAAPEATAVADAPAGELVKSCAQLPQPRRGTALRGTRLNGDDGGLMQALILSGRPRDTLVADACVAGALCCRRQYAGAHTAKARARSGSALADAGQPRAAWCCCWAA